MAARDVSPTSGGGSAGGGADSRSQLPMPSAKPCESRREGIRLCAPLCGRVGGAAGPHGAAAGLALPAAPPGPTRASMARVLPSHFAMAPMTRTSSSEKPPPPLSPPAVAPPAAPRVALALSPRLSAPRWGSLPPLPPPAPVQSPTNCNTPTTADPAAALPGEPGPRSGMVHDGTPAMCRPSVEAEYLRSAPESSTTAATRDSAVLPTRPSPIMACDERPSRLLTCDLRPLYPVSTVQTRTCTAQGTHSRSLAWARCTARAKESAESTSDPTNPSPISSNSAAMRPSDASGDSKLGLVSAMACDTAAAACVAAATADSSGSAALASAAWSITWFSSGRLRSDIKSFCSARVSPPPKVLGGRGERGSDSGCACGA